MKLSKIQISSFQRKIFDWWKSNRRDLPWRHMHDPYKILISEVMLQQTQVSRIIPKYKEFIKTYPTLRSLARASTADVLRLWKGIGYNRRALYLKQIATLGKLPKSEQELSKLPGVGTYTARAILVFAYRKNVPLVDTNIRQIITHFFFSDKQQKESVIYDVASQLLPKGKSWQWHQALMDYGALALEHIPQEKSIPFKNSNRFYRGRIMDLLRERTYARKKLLDLLVAKYNKSENFFEEILIDLVNEGLLTKRNNTISLPD